MAGFINKMCIRDRFYDLYKFDAVKQRSGMATDALPTEDEVYEMTQLTEQMLKENGYVHYAVSYTHLRKRHFRSVILAILILQIRRKCAVRAERLAYFTLSLIHIWIRIL